MKKLYPIHKQIGLTKEQNLKLQKKAKELEKSEGEIIRHLIDEYLLKAF